MKQLLAIFAIVVLLNACKSNDTTTPNRPPNAFTVTPTLKSDGKTITLNWTKAKDPDGDAVTYTVVLKDTLVKNWTDTTYTLSSLDYNYNQAGKVIAKDPKGLTSEASFTATTKTIVYVSIPDPVFEKYLVDNKIDKDGVVNGKMNAEDAKGVTKIDVNNLNINSLVGIESFVDLTTLLCFANQLTTLDVSKNTKLIELRCGINTYVDLLCYDINCGGNKLTSLDLSKNLNLQYVYCANNQLTNLILGNNTNLKVLYCFQNQLTSLDISKNINLETLSCGRNRMTTLDVSKNINLETLDCSIGFFTSLDVSKNINLKSLYCYYNQLTSLDVSKNVNLQILSCYLNKIQSICVNNLSQPTNNWGKDDTATYTVCN